MTDEEMAEAFVDSKKSFWRQGRTCIDSVKQAFLEGLKAGKDMADADLATVAYMQGAERYKTKWHKVADGDLPKGEDAVLIYWKAGDMRCFSVVEPYKVTEDKYIIAWCEIPEFKENI